MKKRSFPLIALAVTQLNAGTVIADFNDNTEGPLGGFEVGTGQGGGTGWLSGDVWANTGTISVISGDLTAPASTGYSVTQDPIPQSVQGTFASGRQSTRAVETPLTGTVWFSYLLNQPTANSRGGITFNQNGSSPGNPRIVAVGTEIRIALSTLQAPGDGAVGLLTLEETALILGRLTIDNAGGAETLEIWINPDVTGDPTTLPAPDTSLTEETVSLDPGLTRIGVQSYSSDGLGGIVDSLRVSDAANAFEVVTGNAVIVLDDPNLAASPVNPFSGTVLTTDAAAATADIIIENTGASNTLTISDTTAITGDDAASYAILTPLPLNIAAGASDTIQIQLDPAGSSRISSATLTLVSNDSSTSEFTIPLEARILEAGGNQLINGDFEADPSSPVNWLNTGNTSITEGIAPGSTFSASLAPLENLRQAVFAEPDWYLECFFQAPDTFDRAFNVLVNAPLGNINLRFQGTSEGAEQTWNLFDQATLNDAWGEAIALPAVQPGATYQLRIIGHAWDGIAPTYDVELSAPNSLALAGKVTGLNRFQGSIPSGPPTQIRFSTEFGAAPGFVVDDVTFANGAPAPSGAPEITSIVHDPVAQTTTLNMSTQEGVEYSLEGADDLQGWLEIEGFTGTGPTREFVENGVTSPRRFYRLLILD